MSAAAPRDDILVAEDVSKIFGGLVAVNDVTFTIPERSIVSIIGPNGAGKTTFFNMLTGLYKPSTGGISFDGRDISRLRPDQITNAGISRTFQNIRLWATMTALEFRGVHVVGLDIAAIRELGFYYESVGRAPAIPTEKK